MVNPLPINITHIFEPHNLVGFFSTYTNITLEEPLESRSCSARVLQTWGMPNNIRNPAPGFAPSQSFNYCNLDWVFMCLTFVFSFRQGVSAVSGVGGKDSVLTDKCNTCSRRRKVQPTLDTSINLKLNTMAKKLTEHHPFTKKVNTLWQTMRELGIRIDVNHMGGLDIVDTENTQSYRLKDNESGELVTDFPYFSEFKMVQGD